MRRTAARPGVRGRRLAGLLAIAVAGLASAATSPAPTPSPEIATTERGTLTVSSEEPAAWIELAAEDAEAALDGGGRTVLRVTAVGGPRVLLTATDLSGGTTRSGYGELAFEDPCAPLAACDASVRLDAILVDPSVTDAIEVDWTAVAETRFDGEAEAPPGATNRVVIGAGGTGAAGELGLARTEPEAIEVGPENPRQVRGVIIQLPDGVARDGPVDPGALIELVSLAIEPEYQPRIGVQVTGDGVDLPSAWSHERVQPFDGCPPAEPCRASLRIVFDWMGGSPDGASLEWSLAAWAGLADDVDRAPATIEVTAEAARPWSAALTGSTEGSTRITRDGGESISITAVVDASGRAQSAGPLRGDARMVVRARLTPDADPAAEIGLSAGDALDFVTIRPGEEAVSYSRVNPAECDARSVCRFAFDASLFRELSTLPEATVDWTATVEFVPEPVDADLEGVRIDVSRSGPPQ